VFEAGTVADAMAGLAQRPDWILLDVMLPDGDGTQVLRRVMSDGLSSKVCVVTGCGPARLEEVHALGPEAVFTKPLDVGRLLGVLSASVG
jgi:DNA-binding response OmpR family regulator